MLEWIWAATVKPLRQIEHPAHGRVYHLGQRLGAMIVAGYGREKIMLPISVTQAMRGR